MTLHHRIPWLWKDPKGRLFLFGAVLAMVIFWLAVEKRRAKTFQGTNPETAKPAALQTAATTAVSVDNNLPLMKRPSGPAPAPKTLVVERAEDAPQLEVFTSQEESVGSVFAAYGRLVPCELVITVDSARIDTPIIGLVTEDVYGPNGDLVIPAGTEVHGRAQLDRMRERIASQTAWVIVFQDGRELRVSGLALNQAVDPRGGGWDIADGSAGLKGDVVKTDNLAEIKYFAATALAGLGQGFQSQNLTVANGTVIQSQEGTVKQALATAAAQSASAYAQQILQRIQQDGFYVRVPAGATFYLYVTETLDQAQAEIAGTKLKGAQPGRNQ